MKNLIVFCLALAVEAYCETYYVSTDGSNQAGGTSPQAPLASIQAAVDRMQPGDECRVAPGIYFETVVFSRDGRQGQPIRLSALGPGPVVVSAADPVTGWTLHEGDIWKARVSWDLGKGENQLFIRGKWYPEARFPNIDDYTSLNCPQRASQRPRRCGDIEGIYGPWSAVYLNRFDICGPTLVPGYFTNLNGDAHDGMPKDSGMCQFAIKCYGSELSGPAANPYNILQGRARDHWVGAVVWQRGWWFGASGVVSGSWDGIHTQGNGTKLGVTFLNVNTDRARWPGDYVVIGHYDLIDKPGEWTIRDSTLYLRVPDGIDPSSGDILLKRRFLAFDLYHKDNIEITGFRIIGGGAQMDSANDCTLRDCQFYCLSHYWVHTWGGGGATGPGVWSEVNKGKRGIALSGTGNIVDKCSFYNSAANGLIIKGLRNTVTNSYFYNIDYGNTYAAPIYSAGDGSVISRNTFERAGRSILNGIGNCKVTYNKLCDAMLLSGDGGLMYTYGQNADFEMAYNWFKGCYGEPGAYLYTDAAGKSDAKIHHNVFFHTKSQGKFVPLAAMGCRYYHNTFLAPVQGRDYRFYTNDSVYADSADKRWANNINAAYNLSVWQFTDTITGDFTLRESSPAIDSGIVIPGLSDEYAGSRPDLGAYEYGKPAWVPGHDWGQPLIEEELWDRLTGASGVLAPRFEPGSWVRLRNRAGRIIVTALSGRETVVSMFDAGGRCVYHARLSPESQSCVIDSKTAARECLVLVVRCGEHRLVRRVFMVR